MRLIHDLYRTLRHHSGRVIALTMLALSMACAPESEPPAPASAVHLLHNARVHTLNPDAPQASALAFDDRGRLLAVGGEELLGAWPGAEARDMQGATIIPGLIDAHGHLEGLAESLTRANLVGARDLEEVLVRLEEHASGLAEGDWLLGHGWDQNDWPGQAFPTRQDLDARFPDRPVWLERIDGHAGWANSAALAASDRKLEGDWQPKGGLIHRDAEGQATGVLVDNAMGLVASQVPPTSDATLMAALDLAIKQMLSLGLTGVHEAGTSLVTLDRYRRLLAAVKLNTRIYAMADGAGATLDWLCEAGAFADPSGRLTMRSVKLYADGALGSRGAALLAPYADDPGNSGLMFLEATELQSQVDRVLGCGLQVGIHAIGDAANRQALDAIEAGMQAHPANPGRHRIEHVQVLDAIDVPRFASLGIIASMQPTHATSDMYWAGERLGPERTRYAYAWRSLLNSGARLAFGSDFPVEAVDPRLGLYAAVTRQDLEGWPEGGWNVQEAVSREEALRGFTLDAAWAAFMETEIGSLEAGKRADFVVLDADPFTVPATQLPKLGIRETWLDGQRVYACCE